MPTCRKGCSGTRKLENNTGISPFFESEKARYHQGYRPWNLKNPNDCQDVDGIAETADNIGNARPAENRGSPVGQVHHSAYKCFKCDHSCGNPIKNYPNFHCILLLAGGRHLGFRSITLENYAISILGVFARCRQMWDVARRREFSRDLSTASNQLLPIMFGCHGKAPLLAKAARNRVPRD